jgi:two-component system sensor histidine kinase BaeS
MSRQRGDHGPRLTTRILGAMVLVVVAGAGTLIVVSLLLAPAIFYSHLNQAGVKPDDVLSMHIDEGFATAILVSTLVGVVIASVVAAAMATLVSRRISQPVAVAAAATTLLANGDYSARVPSPRMGPELDALADGVNSLAERLESTESTRIRLMSDLAHELRTPLAAIDATVEAITDQVLPADEQTLATLTDNAKRLSRLVDDLASVSRAEERSFRLDLARVDLASLGRQAVDNAAARFASSGVALSGPTGAGPVVIVDPDRVVEIIGQLLDNALRACVAGSSVAVATTTAGSRARLTVTDDGSGFIPADAELLFQRFYREVARRSPDVGSGIGLTIARTLAEAHAGSLTASSMGPDRGAVFTLELPLT